MASASSWHRMHSPSVYFFCYRCPRQSVLWQRRSRSSGCARDRAFAKHVPGRGVDDAAHARAGLYSLARVLALIRDLERVGAGDGSGPGGRRACGCGHGGIRLGALVLDMLGASMRLLSIRPLERMWGTEVSGIWPLLSFMALMIQPKKGKKWKRLRRNNRSLSITAIMYISSQERR